jgi:hypothetical protein
MCKENFPFYTKQNKDRFVKHVATDKNIVVVAGLILPEIKIVDWCGMTTSVEYDQYRLGNYEKITKARFDTERAQVIARLISA